MKRYNYKVLLRIFFVVATAIATGILIVNKWYWVASLSFLFLIWGIYQLYIFQVRTVKDMKRLIDAIHFSEFNISFNNYSDKGLAPELIPEIESAIGKFNKKLIRMESRENFYETLLNRIDFAIIVIDGSGKIDWINKPALDLFGKPQPRKLYDLAKVSLSLPEELDLLIPRETKIIRFGDEKQPLQMAATALYFSQEGKQLKLISLKNIQSVLEESESDAWKKLIRVLTHEMMNSLSPIISLSETFSESDPENRELVFKAMQTIHRRSKGLIDFVNNYQKLTKIPEPVKEKFFINDLIEDISRLLKAEGMRFNFCSTAQEIQISADRSQIEQVIINLIKNAWESSNSQKMADVTVSVYLNDYQRPTIEVSDNGEGILPEVLNEIFVPFFTTKSTGSGIGLSICRQIVNLHGGAISVESEVGKGSRFSITL